MIHAEGRFAHKDVGPISSLPHYLPVAGVSAHWCTCVSLCLGLGALVCAGSLLVAAYQDLGPWALSGLCLGSDVSLGLWVHGWICCGVDSCWLGPWARRSSSLGLLCCGCWVVPLGLSSALLLGGCGSPSNGSPWVPVLWDAF
ncbi:hypothetical protein ILYODFUR_037008 [Ilyodon furcidens]|uniref:NADH dehydrogenase subunit 6 n=1 Tax=Ilyodon furcidens TaxID=33524 RepID=A0ABV0T610_9TELE